MNAFFKDNYDVLAPVFLATKKPADITVANKTEVQNLHDAYVNELQ